MKSTEKEQNFSFPTTKHNLVIGEKPSVSQADIVIKGVAGTVRGDCTARAQKVFMESTESQALYLVKMLETMAEGLKIL